MTRIYVTEADLYHDHRNAGYFSEESATYWHGDKDCRVDVNTRDQNRGQGMYLTAGGRWVLRSWTNWQGETDTYTYTTDADARDWLAYNGYDNAATKYFGAIAEERGPGRPEVGNVINVRLGDLLDAVDAYATGNGVTRAEAVRRLIATALKIPADA